MPERRDIQSVLTDIRVDVGQIKVRQEEQGKTLSEVKQKLELGVLRDEYERRHKEMQEEITTAVTEAAQARDDVLRREGASRVWRIFFTAALSAMGLLEVFLHR